MSKSEYVENTDIFLPEPTTQGEGTLEDAMSRRRSIRDFSGQALTLEHLSQLLWSAQGVTGHGDHKRTPPSAGALHPLETYVVIGNVGGLNPGIYRYKPGEHALNLEAKGDIRLDLGRAAVDQTWLADAPVTFVFSAVYERTTQKYGDRGIRYVHMDVGFAAENLHLQAVALGLGTVVMGAFVDDEISKVMNLPQNEQPLLILPVGWPKN